MYSHGVRSASTFGRLPKTRTFSLPFFSPKKGSRAWAKRHRLTIMRQKEQPQKSGLRYNATHHGSTGSPHRSASDFEIPESQTGLVVQNPTPQPKINFLKT
jgi:hypothetical protein